MYLPTLKDIMGNHNYHHVQAYFSNLIEKGELLPGSKLPSERIIGEEFRVTRVTIRQALQNLEAQGLIYRQNRRGWFVTPPVVIYNPSSHLSFNLYVSAQGCTPHTEKLVQQIEPANTHIAQLMGIPDKSPILFLHRRRYIDQRPVLIEKMYINHLLLTGIEKEDLTQSLSKILKDKYQREYRDMDLSFKSTSLPADAAKDLGLLAGHSGLHIERINYTQDKQVLEVDYEFWRHDAVTINIAIRD